MRDVFDDFRLMLPASSATHWWGNAAADQLTAPEVATGTSDAVPLKRLQLAADGVGDPRSYFISGSRLAMFVPGTRYALTSFSGAIAAKSSSRVAAWTAATGWVMPSQLLSVFIPAPRNASASQTVRSQRFSRVVSRQTAAGLVNFAVADIDVPLISLRSGSHHNHESISPSISIVTPLQTLPAAACKRTPCPTCRLKSASQHRHHCPACFASTANTSSSRCRPFPPNPCPPLPPSTLTVLAIRSSFLRALTRSRRPRSPHLHRPRRRHQPAPPFHTQLRFFFPGDPSLLLLFHLFLTLLAVRCRGRRSRRRRRPPLRPLSLPPLLGRGQ